MCYLQLLVVPWGYKGKNWMYIDMQPNVLLVVPWGYKEKMVNTRERKVSRLFDLIKHSKVMYYNFSDFCSLATSFFTSKASYFIFLKPLMRF